jgi:demethylmenaquinone methyltransferase/2-methoxy-6-polyprenyl-1,4-benzoquinol methylase
MLTGVNLVRHFFKGTGPTYDLIVKMFTFGMDARWKQAILRRIPRNPTRIIDQACGTGILTFEIARRFPSCQVVGVDVQEEYLAVARAKARENGIENVEFVVGRAEDVVPDGQWDCIASSYLAKYAELDLLISNARRMLRDGGVLVMHDFTYPRGPYFRGLWEFYFRIMQTVGTMPFPEWKTIFYELPELMRETLWVDDLTEVLQEKGFRDIRIAYFTHGAAAVISAVK